MQRGINDHEEEKETKKKLHDWSEALERLVATFFDFHLLLSFDAILWSADKSGFVTDHGLNDCLGIVDCHPDTQGKKKRKIADFAHPRLWVYSALGHSIENDDGDR